MSPMDASHGRNPVSDLVRESARAWIVRLASGEISADEMNDLRRWLAADPLHKAAFASERASWQQLDPARKRIEDSLATPLATLAARQSQKRQSIRPRKAAWSLGGTLAACLLLMLATGNPLVRMRADQQTAAGEITTVALADGSTAILNTDSAIAIDFENNNRKVTLLKGEAWFDVKPDRTRPFRVDAGNGVAEAVGTAFSVTREKGATTVRVTEGVVALGTRPGDKAVHIPAGMKASLSDERSGSSITPFDAHIALAWRDRRIVIEDQPLRSALAELDRYRPGHILLLAPSHADSHVSGTLTLDRMDHGLEGLASTQGLDVTYLTPYLAIVH